MSLIITKKQKLLTTTCLTANCLQVVLQLATLYVWASDTVVLFKHLFPYRQCKLTARISIKLLIKVCRPFSNLRVELFVFFMSLPIKRWCQNRSESNVQLLLVIVNLCQCFGSKSKTIKMTGPMAELTISWQNGEVKASLAKIEYSLNYCSSFIIRLWAPSIVYCSIKRSLRITDQLTVTLSHIGGWLTAWCDWQLPFLFNIWYGYLQSVK